MAFNFTGFGSEMVKKLISYIMTSNPTPIVTIDDLNTAYQNYFGATIPYASFGYPTLNDFVDHMPDVLQIIRVNNEINLRLAEYFTDRSETENSSRVSEIVQKRLRDLIDDFKNGLLCSELAGVYKSRYKKELNCHMFKYNNMMELCKSLPHIFVFHYVSTGETLLSSRRYTLSRSLSDAFSKMQASKIAMAGTLSSTSEAFPNATATPYAVPSTSSTAPSTSSAAPSASSTAPSTSSTAPSTSSTAPSTSTTAPPPDVFPSTSRRTFRKRPAPYKVPSGTPYKVPSGTPYKVPSGTPYKVSSGTPYKVPSGTPYIVPSGTSSNTPRPNAPYLTARQSGSISRELYFVETGSGDNVIYPPGVLTFSENIQGQFGSLNNPDYIKLVVMDIYDPSKFWVTLHNCTIRLAELFQNMQIYYTRCTTFTIDEKFVKPGIFCVVQYYQKFYRAKVVKLMLENHFVKVHLIDYGSVYVTDSRILKFMDRRFSYLPRQALRGRLAGVSPKYANTPWSNDAINVFRNLVTDKILIAQVFRIAFQDEMIELVLKEENGYIESINDIMVYEDHARFIFEMPYPKLPFTPVPSVSNIHLYPSYYEIEEGIVPSRIEVNHLLEMGFSYDYLHPHLFERENEASSSDE